MYPPEKTHDELRLKASQPAYGVDVEKVPVTSEVTGEVADPRERHDRELAGFALLPHASADTQHSIVHMGFNYQDAFARPRKDRLGELTDALIPECL
jgi:hypothetical protein